MTIGDLTATRADRFPRSTSPVEAPSVAGVTEPMFGPTIGKTRSGRLRRVAPAIGASLLIHIAITIVFVLLWRSMIENLSAPDPIEVEFVKSIPGETTKTPYAAAGPGRQPTPAASLSSPAGGSRQSAPEPDRSPLASSKTLPDPPEPQDKEALQKPENPKPPLRPALMEPPPEPKRAAAQSETDRTTNLSNDKPAEPNRAPAPPAFLPPVITAPQADSSIAPPAPKPVSKPDKSASTQPARDDTTAKLTAALPMDPVLSMPPTFRAVLSASGSSDSQEYKGAVYGILGRVQGVAARARGLGMTQGQVGLAMTIGRDGSIDQIAVMQSSGRADVDAMVMDLVRQAGPFPPPPPGAQQTFTPMIAFGER